MTRVAIIGCGIIGAMIAYELSQIPDLEILVVDRRPPALECTGAALGVLMGAISQKAKGKLLEMRLSSLRRYDTLIPELEAVTGQKILFNRQGILLLCPIEEPLDPWNHLISVRQSQGWTLQFLNRERVQSQYPFLNLEPWSGAIHSPQDRQLDPTGVTLALVAAAGQRGVRFKFDLSVEQIEPGPPIQLQTTTETIATDWLVIAAGLGSTPLTTGLQTPISIRPVLGQALRLRLTTPLPEPLPAITGHDVHIVPLGLGEYWVGATVEFPEGQDPPVADPDRLQSVLEQAIAYCPVLAEGTILKTWSGLRPRPEGRPAPLIGQLPGQPQILLASGHYRNGVLLAPATAAKIRAAIQAEQALPIL